MINEKPVDFVSFQIFTKVITQRVGTNAILLALIFHEIFC